MISYLKKTFGSQHEKTLKKYNKLVNQINDIEPEIEKLSDDELKNKTIEFKKRLSEGATIDDIKVEAFATVREASKRVLGMRHFNVQLIGGLSLLDGNISEMATGEGKTLVPSLPSYLRALEGKGVHVITVNEYLAKRDREITGKILEFLGLTVGLNLSQMTPLEKQEAYNADVTYGIGTEFGFDYLRDHMVMAPNQRVQRPYHFAIIDEVDSVLIDEAKTPLIIAGKTSLNSELFYVCSQLVKRFKLDKDYTFDPESKATNFTDEGVNRIEKSFGIDNLYAIEHQTLYHYMIQSLRAEVIFRRDVDYIVQEGKIELIDMFTGRIMEGRSLSDGLHQAIEAKEGLKLTDENKMQATITIQNYFRMYPILSGMTGTAKTEEKEFQQIYGMDVIPIPTNRPKIRVDKNDLVYDTIQHKYEALTKEVKKIHENGQPILIGTASIEQSELVATYLDKAKLPYQLLNAKSVEKEVQLISIAGQKGQITIATNMAGRGTDILLGEGVAELGGLYVIGTERHESRRIDNQLKGRSGRQGDPGASQFFISIEDEIVQRFAADQVEKLQKSLQTDENGLIMNKNIHDFIDRTQRMCEGSNYSAREYTLKLDDVVNEQRNIIYSIRTNVLESENTVDLLKKSLQSATEHILQEAEESNSEMNDLNELRAKINRLSLQHLPEFEDGFDYSEVKGIILENLQSTLKQIDESFNEHSDLHPLVKDRTLRIIDEYWVQHLESMTRLKEGIGLRGYSQEDPIRTYQKEGLEVFTHTYYRIEKEMSEYAIILINSFSTPE
ncbi:MULTISPECIES: accessory Sec system translocase SecA2 [Heyndrickxia]|uniref:accessory Sec system translocase SecA2 n=1 Tax=Heyndrickxia TaxID=2837504 RepID=UPI001B02B754|nr:accessory Sec system translocase SecA2 [Heyndrickxia oleronia]GIN39822.1 protein translocase subunit SecA 2 [Heyndrickxia oleronia]